MKVRHWITALVLLVLGAAAIVGMVRTRQSRASIEEIPQAAESKGSKQRPAVIHALVDQSPLQTARRVESTAYAQEEKDLAQQAEKVADHEVDLAFFDAFRAAQESPPPLTAALKKLADRKTRLQQALQDDQANVSALTKKIAAASESQKENLQDQLNVAQAQLELDQDELDDATEALVQAGGDPQAEVQRQKQAHDDEETYLAAHPASAANAAEGEYQSHTLLNLFRAWKALRDKKTQLTEALQDAGVKQDNLSKQHEALAITAQQQSESRESAKQQAKGFATNSKTASRDESRAAAQATLDSLKNHRLNQKNLVDLARRIADEKKLGDLYGQWIVIVEARQQAALHNMLEILFWILLVLILVYLANRTIEHFTVNLKTENKRVDTLRAVLKFSAQAIGALAILFLIFGLPSQTTTILDVDDEDAPTHQRERGAEVDGGRRLADAALLVDDRDDARRVLMWKNRGQPHLLKRQRNARRGSVPHA